jgi:hypothetical protein
MVKLCWPRLVRAGRPSWFVDHRITGSPRWRTGYSATYPAAMKCLLADREGLTA